MVDLCFSAPLEAQPHGRATYLVVRLPEDETDLLDDLPVPRVGFRGIRVEATVGATTWKTTVFPDKEGFLLLVARKTAAAEALVVGEPTEVTLAVL